MAQESVQKKLSRVRPPRVHITYEVEKGGALELKELPMVAGVVGDFTGKPDPNDPLPKLKERKFVEIDRDNFDKVLGGMKPRAAFYVDNKLANDGTKLAVELRFKCLDDFHPENVVQQVEPLRKLVQARQRLRDLLAKMDGNDKLNDMLQEIISNTESLQQMKQEVHHATGS